MSNLSKTKVSCSNDRLSEINRRASRSTIEDAELAWEQLELTKLQILRQTALAILTQANTTPSSLPALLGVE